MMLRFSIDLKVLLPLLLAALLVACGGDEPSSKGSQSEGPGRQPTAPDTSAPETESAPVVAESPAPTIDYPIEGSVFPPDFTPPTFIWHDDTVGADAWKATVEFADGGDPVSRVVAGPPPARGEIDETVISPTNEIWEGTPYQQTAHTWSPSPDLWVEIQRRSVEGPAVLSFEGFSEAKPDAMLSRAQVTFSTSTDPIGAPIFYRDVPLMPAEGEDGTIAPLAPSGFSFIAWRLRDVSLPESQLILTGMPTCANCHSFSLDGTTLGMDVDGPQGDKGSYAIAPLDDTTVIGKDEVITWNSFPDKPEGHKTIGFLSRISPDGSYALTTVNESLYVQNFTNHKFLQVFYPTRGILAWYSKATGEMKALPGADDTEYVHCSPVWFPDGKDIVFARAKAFDPYPEGQPKATYAGDPNEPRIQFDLYRLPFNGGRGGTPVPIEGASNNGMSNTFPKVSPDGKWIVITRCENGLLMRPDGRLWILPAEGGAAREMNCNTSLMNSWHSFSPNSRWMVFSSKSNTPYTQMFLTHIDEDGNDTPPILIPNSTAANRAVNIPEFVNRPYSAFNAIEVPAVEHHVLVQDGLKHIGKGDLEAAVKSFTRAIELESEEHLAHHNLGLVLYRLGKRDQALRELAKAASLKPDDPDIRNNHGYVLYQLGRWDEAIAEYRAAIEQAPDHIDAHANLGNALRERGRPAAAIEEYRRVLELKPDERKIARSLSDLLQKLGRRAEAVPVLETLLKSTPDDQMLRLTLAWLLATLSEDGVRNGERAVLLAERVRTAQGETAGNMDVLAAAYAEAGRFRDAVKTVLRAKELQAQGKGTAAPGLDQRMKSYSAGRPHRQ